MCIRGSNAPAGRRIMTDIRETLQWEDLQLLVSLYHLSLVSIIRTHAAVGMWTNQSMASRLRLDQLEVMIGLV